MFFLSFADSKYANSVFPRLREQVKQFKFDKIYLFDDSNLSKEYIKFLKPFHYSRGYGYWRWKSYLVKRILEEMREDDILFYSDAGNYWNIDGYRRFNEYLDIIKNKEYGGLLAFQEPFLEKDYSKGDILFYLDGYHREDITMSLQLWAGCFAIRKCQNSIGFVNEWYEITHDLSCFHLITDKKSEVANLVGFVENRHDQSSFSIILKKFPHYEIKWQEQRIMPEENGVLCWEKLSRFPIQSRRIKPVKDVPFYNYTIKILHNIYLRVFEDFCFKALLPKF